MQAAASSGTESTLKPPCPTVRTSGGRSPIVAIPDCPGMLSWDSYQPCRRAQFLTVEPEALHLPSVCLLSLHRDKSGLGSCSSS